MLICLRIIQCGRSKILSVIVTRKHSSYEKLEGQLCLKSKVSGQQSLMKSSFYFSDIATKVSFLISKTIAKNGKPCSYGELVKDYACKYIVPRKSSFARGISLSHQTIPRRSENMSTNIEHTLKIK